MNKQAKIQLLLDLNKREKLETLTFTSLCAPGRQRVAVLCTAHLHRHWAQLLALPSSSLSLKKKDFLFF